MPNSQPAAGFLLPKLSGLRSFEAQIRGGAAQRKDWGPSKEGETQSILSVWRLLPIHGMIL